MSKYKHKELAQQYWADPDKYVVYFAFSDGEWFKVPEPKFVGNGKYLLIEKEYEFAMDAWIDDELQTFHHSWLDHKALPVFDIPVTDYRRKPKARTIWLFPSGRTTMLLQRNRPVGDGWVEFKEVIK